MFKLNLYYSWSFILFFFSLMFLMSGMLVLINDMTLIFEWHFLSFNSISFCYLIYVDWISMIFSFVVFLISSMVILYSLIYMGDYNYESVRFLMLVLMFVFSMLLMILSPNLISILLGWDGLGLVSYCLVIYYMSLKSYLAGMLTCLVNRLGDIGLLVSLGWMFSYGSWNFLYYLLMYDNYMFYLMIISCFTKSAQIPFSMWLPAAMAAPTPVSALVHSSTLVTAGVYLLIRFFNSLFYCNYLLLFISISTMIMSSFCSAYEYDLKKIVAFSTLSQLGLMMSCLFLGLKDVSFFHLLSHAMFKSLLFLCSGIIIHLMGGSQDIRMMGSICLSMPLTCCCFNISNMALFGFPFLSGFYSKDLAIELSLFTGNNIFIYFLLYLSLGLTSFYSIRLMYYTMMINFNFSSFISSGESISLMKYSIIILTFFSVTFGGSYSWLVNFNLYFMLFPFYMKILTFLIVIVGLWLGYEIFNMKFLSNKYSFFNGSMWFMYSYSNAFLLLNFYLSSNLNEKMNWGEYYGGMGLSYYMLKLSNYIQMYSLGSIKVFFFSMIIWLMFLV